MKKHNSDNIISVYAQVSQLLFIIATPLLLFLVGGSYIVKRYNLPDWVMLICVILAILFMIGGVVNFICRLMKSLGRRDRNKKVPKAFTSSRRDNDYYDDYRNIRKR